MRIRSNLRIVRGWRLCAVLGITLLVGIGAYADSVRKAGPAGKRRVALLSAEGRTGQYKVAPALTTPAQQSGLRQASGNNPACGAGAGSCCPFGNGTPGCDDEDCCNCICDCDPFCCDTEWDDDCAGQGLDGGPCGASNPDSGCAMQCSECFECGDPGCPLECPIGAADEGEVCGADTNGGCNADPDPIFTDAECDMSFCGTAWADSGTRDTDWYLLNLASGIILTTTVTSQFPAVNFIIDMPDFPCPAGDILGDTGCSDACAPIADAKATPPGGEVVVFVGAGNCDGTGIFQGFPCACQSVDYVLEIACEEVVGACCDPGGKAGGCDEAQTQEGCEGQPGGGTWLGGAGADTTCLHCACLAAENECLDGESGGVGCNDLNCCIIVCQNDPFCCEVEWDGSCVDNATTNCPPENDNCEDSLPIFDGLTEYDTTDANTDGLDVPDGLCFDTGQTQVNHDIWFDYQATCTGALLVTTCEDLGGSATYDSDLALYAVGGADCSASPCPPGNDLLIGCNDDDDQNPCGGDPDYHSTIHDVAVVEGDCYKVRVGGWGPGDQGTGTLFIDCEQVVCGDDSCHVLEDCIGCEADCGVCPDPLGGCCLTALGGECIVQTEAGCGDLGGEYLGDDAECFFGKGEVDVFESTPNADIPDEDAIGVSDTINVVDKSLIGDIDIDLQITHTWVGDLCVTVEHNGTSVRVIQRMGFAGGCEGTGCCGCAENNMNILLDDDGEGLIEDQCAADLAGTFIPENPLAAFSGMSRAGDWTITVSDNAGQDTGTLDVWSLHIQGVGSNCDASCGSCPPDQAGAEGEVDPVDLAGLLGCWGPDVLVGCECWDTDGQNGINPVDLAALLGSWGVCPLP